MKRIFLPLIIIAVLGLAAATIVVLVTRPATAPTTNTTNRRADAADVSAANANVRTIVSRDEQGDRPVGKAVSYRGVTFEVVNGSSLDAFHGKTAAAGKDYLVLFTRPIGSETDISSWVLRETALTDSAGGRFPVLQTEVVGPTTGVDTGYFWFEVNEGSSGFRLVFSGEESEASLDIGF